MPSPLKFPQFLIRYNIRLLYNSMARIAPCCLLDKQRQGYVYKGHLSEVLPGNADKWKSRMEEASIVYGTVEREMSLAGKASINELGLNISGGLEKASSITYTLKDVRVKVPENVSPIGLTADINELRRTDKTKWRSVNGLWVAETTYHVASFDVKVNVEGNANLDVDLQETIEVGVGVEVKWKNKKEFTITKNEAVPFGFTGFRI
ncbi:MAG TPA: hypothetical protein PLH93_09770 [Flavobacteriales bacterium]|nr:hypothetical protein [Flavobacteriales bacterium]HQW87463.1 hypothetical protein [Flavobacteriales bacterium]